MFSVCLIGLVLVTADTAGVNCVGKFTDSYAATVAGYGVVSTVSSLKVNHFKKFAQ